jgi:hypothetical protein
MKILIFKKKPDKAPHWGHYGCKLPPAGSSLDKEYLYQESNFDNHQICLQCECKPWKSPTDMFHVQFKRLKLMLQQIFKLRSYMCACQSGFCQLPACSPANWIFLSWVLQGRIWRTTKLGLGETMSQVGVCLQIKIYPGGFQGFSS